VKAGTSQNLTLHNNTKGAAPTLKPDIHSECQTDSRFMYYTNKPAIRRINNSIQTKLLPKLSYHFKRCCKRAVQHGTHEQYLLNKVCKDQSAKAYLLCYTFFTASTSFTHLFNLSLIRILALA